jgi:hypothetical protein
VHSGFLKRIHRQWLISLLLIAVAVRALIPAGFMPSADRPFTLQICPDGLPSQFLQSAHHHHAQDDGGSQNPEKGSHEHGAARAEHCVFAAAAGVAPAPQITMLLAPVETRAALAFTPATRTPELTRHRVQQPRAPPTRS